MNKREAEDAIAKIQAAHPNADPRLQGLTLDEICALALNALASPSILAPVAESELREDHETLDGMNSHEHWGVSVDTHGDELVRIETVMLAGKPDLSEQDLATIRTAARHLLSFAGPSRLATVPSMQTEKGNRDGG